MELKDIEPTSLTDADFILAFNSLAWGLRTLFQQKPSTLWNRFYQLSYLVFAVWPVIPLHYLMTF